MKIEEFYKLLGLRGTVKILKYLNEHEKARYVDLSFIISYASLNTRLTQLEALNIIEHHFNRGKEKREEWYELTEKGKKFGTISAVAGSSEESQPEDITYPLFSDEDGDNSTLCGGGSDGGGGAPG